MKSTELGQTGPKHLGRENYFYMLEFQYIQRQLVLPWKVCTASKYSGPYFLESQACFLCCSALNKTDVGQASTLLTGITMAHTRTSQE